MTSTKVALIALGCALPGAACGPWNLRGTTRKALTPTHHEDGLGFRCAQPR